MRDYIPKETLEEIIQRLVEGLQPEQIILFGSYAYGQPTSASDLDIMIIVSDSTEPPSSGSKGLSVLARHQSAQGFDGAHA